MNVTSLCLKVDIKVNLSYPDNSRDIDAGCFLLEIITFISVVTGII